MIATAAPPSQSPPAAVPTTSFKQFSSSPLNSSNFLLIHGKNSFVRQRHRKGNLFGTNKLRVSASFGGLLGGMFKGTDTGESTRQQYAAIVSTVNRLEAPVSSSSDQELREMTTKLKERAKLGESLDALLPVSYNYLCLCWYFLFGYEFILLKI